VSALHLSYDETMKRRTALLAFGLLAAACTTTPSVLFESPDAGTAVPDSSIADSSVTGDGGSGSDVAVADSPGPDAADAATDSFVAPDADGSVVVDASDGGVVVPTGCPTTPAGWNTCCGSTVACLGQNGGDCNSSGCGACLAACDASAPWCCRKVGTVCSKTPAGC
jgi:hypothetical protein